MLKFLLSFLFLLQYFLYANNNPFQEYNTEILSIDGSFAKINDSEKIVIGSSGIVVHEFDNETSSIIARVSVVEKDGKFAKVKFEVFDLIEQAAFPLPGILPSIGDKITLNYLYNRSLIIVPNEEIFNEVTKHFDQMQWVHPDIIAAYLVADYKPDPNKNTFDILCRKNTTGLIFFALDKKAFFADCQSLKILKSIKSGEIASYQLPFYNRIGEIDSVFWKFKNKKITNYNQHYAKLLGL